MELSSYILLLINFAAIGLLPRLFFRQDGKFTLMWFVTAAPYMLAPIMFSFQYFGLFPSLAINLPDILSMSLGVIGIALSALSVGMIFMTVGTHRIPVALWHQKTENDKPAHIVTWGSYKYVRHPFYTSFLLAFIACILITMNVVVMAIAAFTFVILNYTAGKEEKRLSSEPEEIGRTYQSYIQRTGRFFPKLGYAAESDQQQQSNVTS